MADTNKSSSSIVYHHLVISSYYVILPVKAFDCNQQKSTLMNLQKKGIYTGRGIGSLTTVGILEKQAQEMDGDCREWSDWTTAKFRPGIIPYRTLLWPAQELLLLASGCCCIGPGASSQQSLLWIIFPVWRSGRRSDWMSMYPPHPLPLGFRPANCLAF